MRMKSTEGEIVQVQGGHIVRSTGRKDRHSKVYTSKGPRDRRVRLSAHTAIQFYDVQDRLGYDRPSKAVDWLIKKAKTAIDKLAELPPWQIPNGCNDVAAMEIEPSHNVVVAGSTDDMGIQNQSESSGYNFQIHRQLVDHNHNNANNDSSFIAPPNLDNDSIADTLKSFFPTSSTNSTINFPNYPPDIISRTAHPNEDLGLSLHSFQDHGYGHGRVDHTTNHHQSSSDQHQTLFEANFQRMVAWNNETTGTESRGGGFLFNSPLMNNPQQALAYAQRGPLQSSFTQSSVRAWNDLPNEHHHQRTQQQEDDIHQSSIFGSRFLQSDQGMQGGFCIPARIHGEDQEGSDGPSSSSPPNSHH